jgi:hypothetical protein
LGGHGYRRYLAIGETGEPGVGASSNAAFAGGGIRRLGIEATWFAYKKGALETIAQDWLAKNGLLPNQALQADDQLGRSAPSPARR